MKTCIFCAKPISGAAIGFRPGVILTGEDQYFMPETDAPLGYAHHDCFDRATDAFRKTQAPAAGGGAA